MARIIDKMVGHKIQRERLKSAIQQGRLPSSLLFVGPSGVGKKLCALALSQTLICERSIEEACGECPSCLRVENQQNENLLIIEPIKQQIKIEQARQVIQFLSNRSLGRSRVVLIDQAHLLNPQAANALLKVIEEPPADSYFILVSSTASAILPTVKSRTQVVSFGSLEKQEISQIKPMDGWVLEACHGQVGLATELIEKSEIRQEAFSALEKLLDDSVIEAFSSIKETIKDRDQCLFVARLWQQLLRDSYYCSQGLNSYIHRDFKELIQKFSQVGSTQLMKGYKEALSLEKDISLNLDKGLAVENFMYQFNEAR